MESTRNDVVVSTLRAEKAFGLRTQALKDHCVWVPELREAEKEEKIDGHYKESWN